MGLREAFKKGAQTIIKALDNVPLTVTYTSAGGRVSGVIQSDTSYTGIKMIISKFNIERPGKAESAFENILPTDLKGLIAVDDLSVVPKSGDKTLVTTSSDSTIFNGDYFRVEGFRTDPAEAMYTLHLRQVKG